MQFASAMEKELGVPMSIDEAVLLTLFLCEGNETHKAEAGPVVLSAMHGDSTASSVADVVNSLAGCGNTYAYDMPLDKDMQQACDALKAMIQELDRGQGILLLYDMGSLRTMAELISKETGVQIRTVAVPARRPRPVRWKNCTKMPWAAAGIFTPTLQSRKDVPTTKTRRSSSRCA